MKTHKIDKDFTETMPEIKVTNKHQDTIKETRTTRAGMRTTKTETGLITEGGQINTNTIGINTKHKSFSNFQTKT